ncbi:hypothetical protein BOTCAL_0087g00070 [Botryotinia calthae]|uniref:Azaphilone pigments biosynthesis cluster protein L N-terminal domain-containing protein n=1 Tax=Botryotinia calthae TaxID=38488 RepID=A0A4Y8D7T4_9HELO|nr:hypothetical protein BOTCAL_0087g00070 [Botryotinia calthae]
MADPVGFTASVIAIATLAVQLGDALRKAAEFWEAVQDAPSDIRRLSKELRLVASVFHTIRVEYEAGSTPTNFESMVKDALELAKDDIDQLSEFISELSRNLSIANGSLGRQWRKVQMALKASKIERFRDNLVSVKTTMALLQGSRQQVSLIQVNSKLDVLTTNISSIATTSSSHQIALQTSQEMTQSNFASSSSWKSSRGSVSKSVNQHKTNFLLGTFNFRTISTTNRYNDDNGTDDADNSTTTKTFLIEFLMGFTTCRKGFRFTTTSTFDRYALDVVRRRPNDSEIFELCGYGNVQAVKRLLDRGEASIHDVSEQGESLLHIAAISKNAHLCTMLLDLGADIYWKDDGGYFPISRASTLTCFSTIAEAGFELWPTLLDSLLVSHSLTNISIWRYMYQHKPTQAIGGFLSWHLTAAILVAHDAENVDFLVAWVFEELFALRNFHLKMPGTLLHAFFQILLVSWFESLYFQWLNLGINSRRPLNEYKLTVFLRQWIIFNSQDEAFTTTIGGIYMNDVRMIITAFGWNIEITNAIFQKWTKIFIASGFDVISWTLDGDEESIAQIRHKRHFIHCCKDINFEIVREDQSDNLLLNITSATRPEFSHLDPMFLCEAGRLRRDRTGVGRCLSQVDEAFIENGKFCMNVPGQWEEPLVPNSFMGLFFDLWESIYPQACYSMIHRPVFIEDIPITEEDIQRIGEDFRNGTLWGLSKELPKTSGEE